MADESVKSRAPETRTESKTEKPAHVLLVEDDATMRQMLADAFRGQGWTVTECTEGKQWLQTCLLAAASMNVAECVPEDMPYDVVVSDICMPKLSGLDILRILSESRYAYACPPTILITAFGDEPTHERARKLGAVAVLDKPFEIKDLIEEVRQTVERSR